MSKAALVAASSRRRRQHSKKSSSGREPKFWPAGPVLCSLKEMPKYYCDYCDTFLTHDSPSVRKTHCAGRKHKENVKFYYQKWMEDQAQSVIDSATAAFKAGKLATKPPAVAIPPPPAALAAAVAGGRLPGPFGARLPFPPPPMVPPLGLPPTGLPPGMPPPPVIPGLPPNMQPGPPGPPGVPPPVLPPAALATLRPPNRMPQ